jgi:hypothetical protein
MQVQYVGGVGDFAKLALLRRLMVDRRLAVCWYLTSAVGEMVHRDKHFEYLNRPDEFRHLAPEVFDRCKAISANARGGLDPVTAVQTSGLLGNAVFYSGKVPKQAVLRRRWAEGLAHSVRGANLVFFDPDIGIEGRRLTSKHVALVEIAALRQQDRALIISHRQSGRRDEVKFLTGRLREIGCRQIELIRFRLVSSRFFVICDHDKVLSERLAAFVKQWGDRIKSYAL